MSNSYSISEGKLSRCDAEAEAPGPGEVAVEIQASSSRTLQALATLRSKSPLARVYQIYAGLVAHAPRMDGLLRRLTAFIEAPEHLNASQAATLPCAAVTAWAALLTRGALVPGEHVLVQGTGGVAVFARKAIATVISSDVNPRLTR